MQLPERAAWPECFQINATGPEGLGSFSGAEPTKSAALKRTERLLTQGWAVVIQPPTVTR